jgi:hypothetical protein
VTRRDFSTVNERDTRVRDGHEVADRRCTCLFSAKWVLIDPGGETEEDRGPSEDPMHVAWVCEWQMVVIGYWR